MGKKKVNNKSISQQSNEELAISLIECIHKTPSKLNTTLNKIPEARRADILNTPVDTSKYYRNLRPIPTVMETPFIFLMLKSNSIQIITFLQLFLDNGADPSINSKLNDKTLKLVTRFIANYQIIDSGHEQQLEKLRTIFTFPGTKISFNIPITMHGHTYSFIHYFLNFVIPQAQNQNQKSHLLELFRFMLEHGLDVQNRKNPNNETPAEAAQRLGLTRCKEFIVKHPSKSASTQVTVKDGLTNAAHNAVLDNNPATLEQLYRTNPALFTARNEFGFTPATVAILLGKSNSLVWLRENSTIDFNQTVFQDYTLNELMAALSADSDGLTGKLHLLRLNLFFSSIESDYQSLFDHLVDLWSANYLFLDPEEEQSHLSMISIAVSLGESKQKYFCRLLKKTINKDMLVDKKLLIVDILRTICLDTGGASKIYSKNFILFVIELLLKYGFTIQTDTQSVLHYVLLSTPNMLYRTELTKLLLEHGADPNTVVEVQEVKQTGDNRVFQATALAGALILGDFELAEVLYQHGADPTNFSDDVKSPGIYMLLRDEISIEHKLKFLTLIQDKIDPLQVDNSIGYSMLEAAAWMAPLKVIQHIWQIITEKQRSLSIRLTDTFQTFDCNKLLKISLCNDDTNVFVFLLSVLPKENINIESLVLQLLWNQSHKRHLSAFLADHSICLENNAITSFIEEIKNIIDAEEFKFFFHADCIQAFNDGYAKLIAATMPKSQPVPAASARSTTTVATSRSQASTATAPDATLFSGASTKHPTSAHSYIVNVLKLDPKKLRSEVASAQQREKESTETAAKVITHTSWMNGAIDTTSTDIVAVESQFSSDATRHYCYLNQEVLTQLDEAIAQKFTTMRKTLSLPQGDQGIKRLNNTNFPEIECYGQKVKFEWQLKPKGEFGNERLYGVTIKADEPGQPSLIYFCHTGPALHNKAARDKLMAVRSIPLPKPKPKASPPFRKK